MRKLFAVVVALSSMYGVSAAQQTTQDVSFEETAVFLYGGIEDGIFEDGRYIFKRTNSEGDTGEQSIAWAKRVNKCVLRIYNLEKNVPLRRYIDDLVGAVHYASIFEIDFSWIGNSAKVDLYNGNPALSYEVGDSLISFLWPKSYKRLSEFMAAGGWPEAQNYSEKPDKFVKSAYVSRKQDSNPSGQINRADIIFSRDYVQAHLAKNLEQDTNRIMVSLEEAEYEKRPSYISYAERTVRFDSGRIFFLLEEKSVELNRAVVRRISAARAYLDSRYGCRMADKPKKPF